jgi:hypothetical protein
MIFLGYQTAIESYQKSELVFFTLQVDFSCSQKCSEVSKFVEETIGELNVRGRPIKKLSLHTFFLNSINVLLCEQALT